MEDISGLQSRDEIQVTVVAIPSPDGSDTGGGGGGGCSFSSQGNDPLLLLLMLLPFGLILAKARVKRVRPV